MKYVISFKGNKYQLDKLFWKGQMINDSIDFQHEQLIHCMETGDYTTLENRISNQLIWGGIKEIK